jgi:acylphosphatase
MSEQGALVRRVFVEGYVQGVGYRYFAYRVAQRHNVSGWVRNRRDGSVEALARGAAADVDAFIAELGRGPYGAEVRQVRVVPADDDEGAGPGFDVRPTA